MMTPPIAQIVWSHRRPFLFVMCLTFLVLACVIFTLPERATIRSSIEIGSALVGKKKEAFEPPENITRRIPAVYGPAALLAIAEKETSPSISSALQNPSAESIGNSVVMVNIIDPSLENDAKKFQQTIADLIIKELTPRARALRENITTRISLARKVSENLEQQIKADASEIGRINALSNDLQGQIENQRAHLATLYQRTAAALQPGESATVEAHIRELQAQISTQTNLVANLMRERSDLTRDLAKTQRQYEEQDKAVVDAQFEENSFRETRISLLPALMSAPTRTAYRRLNLLLAALAVSVLAGFGTVVLLHNFVARRI